MTLPATIWRLAAGLVAPLLPWHLSRRVALGKEIPDRLAERRGEAAARPPGRLLWLHAASVGEARSVLPVIEALAAAEPALHILVTTGTVTGAETLMRHLPAVLARPGADGFARVAHRFLPLDVPRWVGRFLDGWRPDAGALVESELWPNLLEAARRRGLPMALVNARISPRSFARWRRFPVTARAILGGFRLVLARTEEDLARLTTLGAAGARNWGDLKASAPPLSVDPAALERLRRLLGDRPVFLAASTHPGEEAMVLEAHERLAVARPDLLTVLVPRHPDRGASVAELAERRGLAVARRAAGGAPGAQVAVYVADTLGELGLFYRLAGVALVGGSLVPHGGQNPLEAARLGCPILFGPHTINFTEAVAQLLENGGALRVRADAGALAEQVEAVLSDRGRTRAMVAKAAMVAEGQAGLPGRVASALLELMPPAR
jgi:3-deoxy-D-manno-octulosonic-acid transferase